MGLLSVLSIHWHSSKNHRILGGGCADARGCLHPSWGWVVWGGSGACSLRVQWPWYQVLCVAVKTTLIFFCLLAEARQWEGQRGKRRSQSMQAPTTWESPKCGRGLPLPENSASCFPKGLLGATDYLCITRSIF